MSGYGVLCEVYEVSVGGEGPRQESLNAVSFKARATHRFRCLNVPKHSVPIHVYSRCVALTRHTYSNILI